MANLETSFSQVDINNLGDGIVNELFQREMTKVLENISDVNTDYKAKRKIIVEIEVTTDSERRLGNVTVSSKTKLPGVRPADTAIHLVRDSKTGKLTAYQNTLVQGELIPADGNVTSLEKAKEERK
jgi:hypothetical protein